MDQPGGIAGPSRLSEPITALSDPEAYLAGFKFNRRLIRCKRTKLPVTYSDTGDPNGIPLLWILPSGCSRWFGAPQDPLANIYGIRLIAVDRPGTGGTPNVPLKDRIRLSCEMIESVIEELDVRISHVLANSAGIYYVPHLLQYHPKIFTTGLNPPPKVYLLAPWTPLLPSDHPDYYFSYFAWIPDKLITTQHLTLPFLTKAAKNASSWWEVTTKTALSSFDYAKAFFDSAHSVPVPTANGGGGIPNLTPNYNKEGEIDEEEESKSRLWGKFECCVGCTTTEYFHAENFEGVGQEHLQCLNRGPIDTGPDFMIASFESLAGAISQAQAPQEEAEKPISHPLDIHVWWGWKDGMVPRQGQLWFNKTISSWPEAINVTIHDVPEGDHNNLLGRIDGIYHVYDLVKEHG